MDDPHPGSSPGTDGGFPPAGATAPGPATAPSPSVPGPDRDAVIFLPGIGDAGIDQTIDGIAARLSDALERELPDPAGTTSYVVRANGSEEGFGSDGRRYAQPLRTRLRTICRRQGSTEIPVLDVYSFDYRETLLRRHREQGTFLKAVGVGAVIVSHVPRLLRAFARAGAKSRAELTQILVTTGLMALLVFYVGFLLVTLLATADTVIRNLGGSAAALPGTPHGASTNALGPPTPAAAAGEATPTPPAPAVDAAPGPLPPADASPTLAPQPPDWLQRGIREMQAFSDRHVAKLWGIFVFLAGLGLIQPRWRDGLVAAAVEYTCIAQYLETALRQSAVTGQFATLVDHVMGKGRYRQTHVIGFSFGSIVAIDALFPKGQPPPQCCDSVDTLTTIGSPFDLIRAYYPAYFEQRHPPTPAPRWFNIYQPADVLGSNFRDDKLSGAATRGIHVIVHGARAGTRSAPDTPPPAPATPAPNSGPETAGRPPSGPAPLAPCNLEYGGGPRLQELGWVPYLFGIGLRAHTMYWEAEYESEYSSFHLVVRSLYPQGFPTS